MYGYTYGRWEVVFNTGRGRSPSLVLKRPRPRGSGATASREMVVFAESARIVDNVRHDTVVYKWLFQIDGSWLAKCVRRIIEFYIMLRTPAKLLLLGSYDLAYTVSHLFAGVR